MLACHRHDVFATALSLSNPKPLAWGIGQGKCSGKWTQQQHPGNWHHMPCVALGAQLLSSTAAAAAVCSAHHALLLLLLLAA